MRKGQIVAPLAPLGLFYSYAHEDEALRDRLEKHLVQLRREGLISEWHDRAILPGEAWAHEIDTHLEAASIILLLVSPDFLASDFCYDNEMQRALERHRRGEARVVPIILRQCDWPHSPLKDLQCLPRDGTPITQWPDQDEVFNTITQGLRKVIEKQQALSRPHIPLSPQHRQDRMRMLKQVRTIWIDGLLTQSLHHAAQIELHLQDRPDVLANPWRLQIQELQQAPRSLPTGTSIAQVYDEAEGELLILGEPGAGKTTLLLELARTLLERAEQDERLRMPIIFHLSSWAEKRQPFNAWLVDELWTKYQVPRRIGQSWIDADQVLPLLDGLDEVAKVARNACVQQINDAYQARLERNDSPLVVCCRSEEYAKLSESLPPLHLSTSPLSTPSTHIMLRHAVSIEPLTDEQIDTYLAQASEQVQGLRQALHADAELHSLARQPLMLTIFTFAYQGATVAEVPTGETRADLQHTIFAHYVEHMLKRRGQSRRWQPAQVIHWLTFLAQQMQQHDQSFFSIENLQPTWLAKKWMAIYQWCVVLVVGLVSSLVFGPVFSLFIGQVSKPVFKQTIGLVVWSAFEVVFGSNFWLIFAPLTFVLLVGLAVGLFVGLDTHISPSEALTWSWEKARVGLISGLSVAMCIWIVAGIAVALEIGSQLTIGLAIGLGLGLISGLLIGPVFGLSGRQLPKRFFLSPNQGIWLSSRNGLISGLTFGAVSALVLGLVFGLGGKKLVFGLVIGLFYGLIGSLIVGLKFGLDTFVKHFILRFFLSLRRNLPWDLIPFLDEATERLFLRKVGGSYIFVHRQLRDYFAEVVRNDKLK